MDSNSDSENGRQQALDAIFAGLAPEVSCRGRAGDYRLATYRTPGGQLMCLARSGSIVSEARVVAALCGTEQGCHGVWHCLTTHRAIHGEEDL